MHYKILFFIFFISINSMSGTYAASIAFPTKQYTMVQDTIVIEEIDAARAYNSAVSFYNSVSYYVLAILALNVLSVVILILHARADRNIEKAMLFYQAVGDKERVAVLKNLQERSNKILPLYMLSFFLRAFLLLVFIFAFSSFGGASGLLRFTGLFGIFFIAYFFLFEALIFKTKSKVASKIDNNLTLREILGMK
jgi:hypothetical protein